MVIQQEKVHSHWNYFLNLEDDLKSLSRWIEFDTANENCFSLELARLLMVATSEVDVVAKMLCKEIDQTSNATSINSYQNVIVKKTINIHEARVKMPRFGMTFNPWQSWGQDKTPPKWWQDNNKVKHHRSTHFNRATLKNVLNAHAGLFILLLLYYRCNEAEISPVPQLFEPINYGTKIGIFISFYE